jgi:hypothetical protein
MAQAALTPSQLATFNWARAVGAVHTPSAEEMAQTLEDLRKVQGSALVAGGVAVIHYGYERSTQDVDILYAYADGRILERLKTDFRLVKKLESGWHKLEHRKTGVGLELIPEGALGTYGFIPGPKTVGGENGFISLYGLVWLKLISWRPQDRADLDILAKARFSEFTALRARLHPDLHEHFDQVIAEAKWGMEHDPTRAPDDQAQGHDAEGVGEAPARYAKKRRAARTKRKTTKVSA